MPVVPGWSLMLTPSKASNTCAQRGSRLRRQAHQHSKHVQLCMCFAFIHQEVK